jgi:hypothetical protein
MFVHRRWRLGARRLGETVERGALRAGMWLVLREGYVRTENKKQVGQQKCTDNWPACAKESDTSFSHTFRKHEPKFCTERNLNPKHASSLSHFWSCAWSQSPRTLG